MSTSFQNESHKSPEVLEQEIDAKRRSINNIVDSLESRFTPGQLIDQALAYTKGNGGEFFQNLGTTLKNNPVPTTLTGLSLAWLAMNQNKPFNPGPAHSGPGLGEKIGDAFHNVTGALSSAGDGLRNAADSAKAKGQHMRDRASDSLHRTGDSLNESSTAFNDNVHHMGNQLNAQASQLKGQLNQVMKEQPLVLAAIGIALGAAIGAALPTSKREDQLFGKASDKTLASVKAKGEQVYEAAKEQAKPVAQALKGKADGTKGTAPAKDDAGTDLSAGLGIRS